jgi:hypothetical protein
VNRASARNSAKVGSTFRVAIPYKKKSARLEGIRPPLAHVSMRAAMGAHLQFIIFNQERRYDYQSPNRDL